MSRLSDQLTRVAITVDSKPESFYLPTFKEIWNKLVLGDRVYQSHAYVVAVKEAGGEASIRLSKDS